MPRIAAIKGVDPERIVVEDRSASTEENLLFSRALMEKETPKVILVTRHPVLSYAQNRRHTGQHQGHRGVPLPGQAQIATEFPESCWPLTRKRC